MNRITWIVAALTLVGSISCKSSTTVSSATDVKAPTNLKVEALEGGAHLTWQDNSDNEAGFMIDRMTGSADYVTIGMVPFDTTQYHDPNLVSGTVYMYRVMAMPKSGGHGTGNDAYSNEVTFSASAGTSSATAGSGSTSHTVGGASGGHT